MSGCASPPERRLGGKLATLEEGVGIGPDVTAPRPRTRRFRAGATPTGSATGQAAGPPAPGLFELLARDWARLVRSPTGEVVVRLWAGRHPVLHGARGLAEVLDRLDRGSRTEQDALLHALLLETGEHAPLAGRTVLQAMLPKLTRLTRSVRPNQRDGPDPDDRASGVVAAMWEAIVTWPSDRPAVGVAGRLALDTLNRVWGGCGGPPG